MSYDGPPKRNNLNSSGTTALPGSDHAKASGPAVWLDMDQQALDDAYDQSKYAPNRSQIVERIASNSDMARQRLGAPRRFAYGPTANEALDLYPAVATNAPVSIFVHGGAWQRGLAKNYGSWPSCSCALARIMSYWILST